MATGEWLCSDLIISNMSFKLVALKSDRLTCLGQIIERQRLFSVSPMFPVIDLIVPPFSSQHRHQVNINGASFFCQCLRTISVLNIVMLKTSENECVRLIGLWIRLCFPLNHPVIENFHSCELRDWSHYSGAGSLRAYASFFNLLGPLGSCSCQTLSEVFIMWWVGAVPLPCFSVVVDNLPWAPPIG